ncbi:hypothetical protein LRS12_17320 [Sphingomonas sp. J344]|uniref:hypothetical protein n=1 Tax=Sphingomonas sp. J344 TaxID=2898434 RepID=UPI0021508405|nr:hypothetical protein [Sphingomonas sp. J344]MCR5872314.1 hypothetical protein [Sphingomonas sp. J344]
MVAVLAALLFTTAFAVSIWAMFVTIAPRLDYMRALMLGKTVPAPAPVNAARVRVMPRAAPRRVPTPLRAAA